VAEGASESKINVSRGTYFLDGRLYSFDRVQICTQTARPIHVATAPYPDELRAVIQSEPLSYKRTYSHTVKLIPARLVGLVRGTSRAGVNLPARDPSNTHRPIKYPPTKSRLKAKLVYLILSLEIVLLARTDWQFALFTSSTFLGRKEAENIHRLYAMQTDDSWGQGIASRLAGCFRRHRKRDRVDACRWSDWWGFRGVAQSGE
jgi:hypothetical protein